MSDFDKYYDDYAYDEYMRDEYECDLIENALKELSYENVQFFLGTYGDAIEKRISVLLNDSERLLNYNFHGPSLVLSATSIEIIIRFFLIRPLVQGAFLSDEWADLLSARIIKGKPFKDTELLPLILNNWDVDIYSYKLSNEKLLWETIKSKVFMKRNLFVHQGEFVNYDESNIALECAVTLLNIVKEISKKFGFTLNTTGKWSEIKNGTDDISNGVFSDHSNPLVHLATVPNTSYVLC